MPKRFLFALVLAAICATAVLAQPIAIDLDASDVGRKILHSRLVIPARPGPLTLLYPKWIPGEHGPTGPIGELVGVSMTSRGQQIPWQRDPADLFAFQLTVPQGAGSVEVTLDFITPSEGGNFTAGPSVTPHLAVLSWNTALLYPRGARADDLQYAATLRIPSGWKYATALPAEGQEQEKLRFKTVTLTTLVDSPVLIGAHFKRVGLEGDPIPHEIDIAAESERALALPPDFTAAYQRLVAETGAMFGGRPYRRYHWLLALSGAVAHFGLEHHESSDNRMPEETLLKDELRRGLAFLLAHEFVHTWNGKYRRPADMVRADFHEPLQTNLLWVYEGLTQYLGTLLSARTGLWTPEYYREVLARIAAEAENRPGRLWRPLEDTAVSAQILFGSPMAWRTLRRGVDFYDESVLVWLEADAIIRQKTGGKRSLDDFLRAFYGGQHGAPALKTYTLNDVVSTLGSVAPHDWDAFFRARMRESGAPAPLGGLAANGWKLTYTEAANSNIEDTQERNHYQDWQFSLGLLVGNDGRVQDAIPGSPAARAGVSPGMKLVAVNKRRWSKEVMKSALAAAKTNRQPIELLVETNEFFSTHQVEYSGGERYPHLERDPSRPDTLPSVIKPLARQGRGR